MAHRIQHPGTEDVSGTVGTAGRGSDAGDPSPQPASRRRRRFWLVAIAALGAALVAFGVLRDTGGDDGPAVAGPEPEFAEVTVADLLEEETYDGTLGAEAADPIRAGAAGTVTAAAAPGETLTEGDVLFELDGEPVVLLTGDVPSYRDLETPEDPTVPGLTNRLSGTVTRVAEPGIFEPGDVLYWVDEQPVVLLEGDLPQYRAMSRPPRGDLSGPDVVQLKQALISLGYDPDGVVGSGETFGGKAENMVERWQEDIGAEVDGAVGLGEVIYAQGPVEVVEFTIELGDVVGAGQAVAELPDAREEVEVLRGDDVLQLESALLRLGFDAAGRLVADGVWDQATEDAVIEWQRSIGAADDGVVALHDVVFLADPVRVLGTAAPVGTTVNPGGAVLEVSAAQKLVTMDLPAADQGLLESGDGVVVELPDGTEASAVVIEVATVATASGNDTVFEVTVALDDPALAADLEEAPVEIHVVTDSALGVLTVPVTALLALAEGGYAVEVDAGDGTTALVGVDIGFFADGRVEVDAPSLRSGHRVVVP